MSRPLGDLDSATICTDHEVAATEILIWQATIPAVVARDIDPDIHPTRFAIDLAANLGVHNIAVQHHHAHAAAICAEHGLMEPVIGLVLDDVGFGTDGGSWGGELLWLDGAKFERLGHLSQIPMPGGEIAQHETWRLAAGVLHQLQRSSEINLRFAEYPAAADLAGMLAEGRNCPHTSSAALIMASAATLLKLGESGNHQDGAIQLLETAATGFLQTFGSAYLKKFESR